MKKETEVTKELLLSDGWIETPNDHPASFMEKKIPNRNHLNNSEDSDIALIIHGMYGGQHFAVALPDGGMLNLNIESMEQLKIVEEAIVFYDPPF